MLIKTVERASMDLAITYYLNENKINVKEFERVANKQCRTKEEEEYIRNILEGVAIVEETKELLDGYYDFKLLSIDVPESKEEKINISLDINKGTTKEELLEKIRTCLYEQYYHPCGDCAYYEMKKCTKNMNKCEYADHNFIVTEKDIEGFNFIK